MALPEHLERVEGQPALAPYNFVPLPERAVPAEPEIGGLARYDDDQGRLTGRIDCTLTTWSPLYVRCGIDAAAFARGEEAKNQPDFFHQGDRLHPVIPGSSLRGMLRALVEIAAYAKVERVPQRGLVYRVVGDRSALGDSYRTRLMRDTGGFNFLPLMRAGFLEKHGSDWQIRPAQESADKTSFARIEESISRPLTRNAGPWRQSRNAWRIYVQVKSLAAYQHNQGRVRLQYAKVERAAAQPGAGLREGVLVHTGFMQRKHMQFVFNLPDPEVDPLEIDDAMLQDFREQISQEQKKLLGPEGALNDGQPVFYITEDDAQGNEQLVFFGHAMMFRLPYKQAPVDFVPAQLRDPQQGAPAIDLAEAIFGFVRQRRERGGEQACAGRVSVGDAQLVEGQADIWYRDAAITPHILGSPKPTTFQHYLVQRSSDRKALHHYATKPASQTALRGHKLYWHKGSDPEVAMDQQQRARASDTQVTSIRPVRAGLQFRFSLWVENLSRVELGALLWVLRLSADERYRLKLGMGKPLGMGAVSIQATVHRYTAADRYGTMFDEAGTLSGGEAELDAEAARGAVADFERYVLDKSGEGARGYAALAETLRMRCLLALLSWPGPAVDQTRYLEIERDTRKPYVGEDRRGVGKINEYLDRPVLPGPLQVHPAGAPQGSRAVGRRGPAATNTSATQAVQSASPTHSQRPTALAPQLPAVGAIFAGVVTERNDELIVIAVPGFPEDQAVAVLRVESDTPPWNPKDKARVEVVSQRKRGDQTILTVKRAPKK